MAYYAWSPIRYGKGDNQIGTIAVGEEVTKNKINASNEEWDILVDSGAIRERKYPDDLGTDETPNQRDIRVALATLSEAQVGNKASEAANVVNAGTAGINE